jgi:hypothetical protein
MQFFGGGIVILTLDVDRAKVVVATLILCKLKGWDRPGPAPLPLSKGRQRG